jgi:hypothetical protein
VAAGLTVPLGAFAILGDGESHSPATPTTAQTLPKVTAGTSAREREIARGNRQGPTDLDCDAFSTADIPITGDGPNRLDTDGNGIGCESESP